MKDLNSEPEEEIQAPEMTFNYLLQDTVFFGYYPIDDLKLRIKEQFENYITMEDDTNFFEIALNSFQYSLEVINVEFDEYTLERKELISNMYLDFINYIIELIETNLTISIPNYELGLLTRTETEYILNEIYKYFILKARKNFKKVITAELKGQLESLEQNPTKYLEKAQEIIMNYGGLISQVDIEQFLQITKAETIYDLYDSGEIIGNFLRRYSPRLYRHPDYLVEILNQLMIQLYFKDESKAYLMEEAKIK